MEFNAENERGYPRRVKGITTSGKGKIVVNGVEVDAEGPDIGDLARVTAGAANLKRRGGAFGLNDKTGNVTLGGIDTGVSAADYADGVTAGGLEAISDGYTKNGGRIVRGRQAAETGGFGNLVRWDDAAKRMSVAGVNVPYLYVTDDGNAMVSEDVMNSVLADVKNRLGVSAARDIVNEVRDRHKSGVDRALKKVVDRERWSYDSARDPAYEAYARMFGENAEKAYNRAMGSGGLYSSPNSYQMYQALAAYGDNMQRLSDQIPSLAQQDYSRYSDEQTRNLAALNALTSEREKELAARTAANENQLSRLRGDDRENYSRAADALLNYPLKEEQLSQAANRTRISANEVVQSDIDTDMHGKFTDLDYRIKTAQLNSQQVKNIIEQVKAAQQRAALYNGGQFMKADMDALGIAQDMERYPNSGGYPNPWDHEINEKLAQWYEYTLPTQYGVYW